MARSEDTNRTILVVDDDEGARALATAIHRREGWAVLEAVDGLRALRPLHEQRPDLVLRDLVRRTRGG